MALSDWSEKQLLGLTAGVAGGVLLVMAGLVAWVYLGYRSLNKEIRQKKMQAQGMQTVAATIEKVREKRNKIALEFEEQKSKLPTDVQLGELITQISKQAGDAKLEVNRFVKKREPPPGRLAAITQYKSMHLELRCEGDYNSFGDFLNRIERKIERFIAVKSFKISGYKDGLEPGAKQLKITLELVTYKYADASAPGAR